MRRTHLPLVAVALLAPFVRAWQDAPAGEEKPRAAPRLDAGSAAQQALADAVDGDLRTAWKAQSLAPAAPADDATWLRRLSVDLCGAIPTREEVEAFLADPADACDPAAKRASKIDQYLQDRRFAENLSYLWCNLLLAEAGKDGDRTRPWLRNWLEQEIASGSSFATITRHLLADTSISRFPGPTAYLLTYRDTLETLTGVTARTFLGLQIQCAQCHDDPNGRWTQKDFNGFTGFFADLYVDHVKDRGSGGGFRVTDRPPGPTDPAGSDEGDAASGGSMMAGGAMTESGEEIDLAALRQIMLLKYPKGSEAKVDEIIADPKKRDQLIKTLPASARARITKIKDQRTLFGEPRYPGGDAYVPVEGQSKRTALAEWVVAPDNPWFARAIVNRVWTHLFGKGLVEPVDDLPTSSDPALPQTLESVARSFAEHDFDLRFLIGALVRTRAYALGAATSEDPREFTKQERWFAAHPMRPLTAEQMACSLLRLHGQDTPPPATLPENVRKIGVRKNELIAALSRHFGTLSGSGRGGAPPGIQQVLFLMNGEFAAPPAELAQAPETALLMDASRPAVERLAPWFHALLARPPTQDEAEPILALIDGEPAERRPDATAAASRVYWALVNSTEFHTNR